MFTKEVLNGFEMIGRMSAAGINPTREGHRAFVAVYPPKGGGGGNWLVRKFEIPKELIDKYFGMEDLVDSKEIELETLEQVESLLKQWGVDSGTLQAPWKNDYPL